jgi:acyl-CoA hydrolase
VRRRRESQCMILVTDGNFTIVAIDEQGKPHMIRRP